MSYDERVFRSRLQDVTHFSAAAVTGPPLFTPITLSSVLRCVHASLPDERVTASVTAFPVPQYRSAPMSMTSIPV